jgi:hypothetical protein
VPFAGLVAGLEPAGLSEVRVFDTLDGAVWADYQQQPVVE